MQGRACASVSAGCAAPALDAGTAEASWRCRCASSESVGGVFGIAWAPPGALRGAGTHCWRGRRFFGVVGCPPGFYVVSCPVARSQSYRGPTGPWLNRGVRFARSASPLPWLGSLLSGNLVCSLGKAQTRQPTCASLRIQSHLCEPTTMQSMLLLFACSATALLPAPARQHRARGVMRMGWGLCGNQPVRRVHPTVLH